MPLATPPRDMFGGEVGAWHAHEATSSPPGGNLNSREDRIGIVTYPDRHGPIFDALEHITARKARYRTAREGARGPATRRHNGGKSTSNQHEHHDLRAIASEYSAREDDLMTNASRISCLPEQKTAYWDAALEPTQAALNEEKTG